VYLRHRRCYAGTYWIIMLLNEECRARRSGLPCRPKIAPHA
jgi:hypothetical protein